MKTNIFVPSKINVGFQNRSGTYTGKLAYVIYFDEKGKLRKETSWNSWRDETIPNEIYDNEPTEGFVLNKKVGGVEESWGWDARRTYTRVYDPRGFEFEITIPNLLWILENCNCIKGKGLEGEFVYGWDGKDLVLVPVESSDYKEIQAKNKIIHNNEFIKAKDLIIGATYETLNGEKYVYMGKYDTYQHQYNTFYEKSNYRSFSGWLYPLDDSWIDDSIYGHEHERYRNVNTGKQFWFIKLGNPEASWYYDRENRIVVFKSVTRKLSGIVTTECENYPELYELLQKNEAFSPIDYSKNKILPTSYEDFNRKINEYINKGFTYYFSITHLKDGRLTEQNIYYDKKENKFYYEVQVRRNSWSIYYDTQKVYIDSIEELYKQFQPMYGEQYLENGILYKRRGYYGTEK